MKSILSVVIIGLCSPLILLFAGLQFLECKIMAQDSAKRTAAETKLATYLENVRTGADKRVNGARLGDGVFVRINTYRGPNGSGKVIHLFTSDGITNRCRVIVTGAEKEQRERDWK